MKIVICIEDGLIAGVFSDTLGTEVRVIDYDAEEIQDDEGRSVIDNNLDILTKPNGDPASPNDKLSDLIVNSELYPYGVY